MISVCPEGQGHQTRHRAFVEILSILPIPPVVREHAGIPDDQNILTCIAMGYPNEEFSANSVKSRRADLEDFVNFVGFD